MSDEKRPSPMERLAFKVQQFGDDAPLEEDEAAAFFGVGTTTFERMNVPACELLPRTRRWRYGTLKDHLKRAEAA
jgi:hypothetical protein